MGEYDWDQYKFYIYDCSGYYITTTVEKTWLGWKNQSNFFTYPKTNKNTPVKNIGELYYWTDAHGKQGIQILPIICSDKNVAQIEISFFGKTEKKDIICDRLTIFAIENTDSTLSNLPSGEAYDKFGNILYKLQEDENMEWNWVKVYQTDRDNF